MWFAVTVRQMLFVVVLIWLQIMCRRFVVAIMTCRLFSQRCQKPDKSCICQVYICCVDVQTKWRSSMIWRLAWRRATKWPQILRDLVHHEEKGWVPLTVWSLSKSRYKHTGLWIGLLYIQGWNMPVYAVLLLIGAIFWSTPSLGVGFLDCPFDVLSAGCFAVWRFCPNMKFWSSLNYTPDQIINLCF